MSQVVVTRDAGGKYLSAVRHSYPSGTNPRGVTRLGRRLLVTGSIEYTVKLASAASRQRRKFKTVHAQRPDQIPPRPFHASPSSPLPPTTPIPSPARRERARVRVTPLMPPSFPRRREPRENKARRPAPPARSPEGGSPNNRTQSQISPQSHKSRFRQMLP